MDLAGSCRARPAIKAAGAAGGVARPGNSSDREAVRQLREGQAVLVVREAKAGAEETAEAVVEGWVAKP